MKKIVKYTLSKVTGTSLVSSQKWQGHVISSGTIQPDQFYKIVATESNRTAEDVEYVIKRMRKTALDLISQGYVVHMCDGIILRPTIKGSFPTIDSPFDPNVNTIIATATTRGEMRKCDASSTTYENVIDQLHPVIDSIADKNHEEENVLYVGGAVYVQGKYIKLNTVNEDEGVFLLNPTTEQIVARGTILKSDLQLVDAVFKTWPAVGNYLFRLATRGGRDADHSLYTITKPVTVKASDPA